MDFLLRGTSLLQMFADYDETEIGALDWDEIEGELDVDSQLFQKAANDFIKERQVVSSYCYFSDLRILRVH